MAVTIQNIACLIVQVPQCIISLRPVSAYDKGAEPANSSTLIKLQILSL